MPVTMKDVARRAHVSTATVSRVLSTRDSVSPELRERVQEAIQELDFRPSHVARNLRMRTSRIIGVIISDIRNPFFPSLVRGVEDIAHANGYSLILCNSDEDPAKEELYVQVLSEERVAGAIVVPVRCDSTAYDEHIQAGLPIVAVDRCVDHLDIDTVMLNNMQGAYLGVSHIIQQGCTRIGLIGGPLHTTTGRERLEGYKKALAAHGIALDEALIKIGDYMHVSGYDLACELLEMKPAPAGIFVANNMMTLGALQAIRARGLDIPRDVVLVGFGNVPGAELLDPAALTTVSQPTYELGCAAVNVLLRRMADKNLQTMHIRLDPVLVARESMGCH